MTIAKKNQVPALFDRGLEALDVEIQRIQAAQERERNHQLGDSDFLRLIRALEVAADVYKKTLPEPEAEPMRIPEEQQLTNEQLAAALSSAIERISSRDIATQTKDLTS